MIKRLIASVAFIMWFVACNAAEAQSNQGSAASRRGAVSRGATQTAARGAAQPSRGGSPQTRQSQRSVRPASHQMIVEGETIVDEGYVEGFSDGYIGDGGCDSCGGSGCDSCSLGEGYCDSCSVPHRLCICFPAHGWVHAEYLLWYQSGMRVPPLVTTSPAGTARAAAGVLGQPATSVLFGNDEYQTDDRSGFRIRFGWWLAAFPGWGLEGEYAGLGTNTESFFQQSTGSPIIARPFFNVLTGAEDSELVAFPSVATGSIGVTTTSQLEGAAVRLRKQLCSSSGCGYSPICCQMVPTSSRLDATVGYRFWELDESLMIHEQLTSLQTSDPGSFDITDTFSTRNQFNGAELGFIWQGRRGWWSLDALMRLGIGNVHQTVTINGSTSVVDNGTPSNFSTGVLAQRTNIGTYDRDKFTMVPELGLTLGYQLTRRIRMTGGYSLVYWGNVVRPGDQVDLDVNPNLLAPEVTPFTGALRPQFQFVETDYWVQGLSFGGEFRW